MIPVEGVGYFSLEVDLIAFAPLDEGSVLLSVTDRPLSLENNDAGDSWASWFLLVHEELLGIEACKLLFAAGATSFNEGMQHQKNHSKSSGLCFI